MAHVVRACSSSVGAVLVDNGLDWWAKTCFAKLVPTIDLYFDRHIMMNRIKRWQSYKTRTRLVGPRYAEMKSNLDALSVKVDRDKKLRVMNNGDVTVVSDVDVYLTVFTGPTQSFAGTIFRGSDYVFTYK